MPTQPNLPDFRFSFFLIDSPYLLSYSQCLNIIGVHIQSRSLETISLLAGVEHQLLHHVLTLRIRYDVELVRSLLEWMGFSVVLMADKLQKEEEDIFMVKKLNQNN